MEVVVLLLAVVGIALLVIPRVQRRRAGARRPAPVKTRKTAAAPVAAAPTVATWSPSSDVDAWDDDLGWEGVDSTPPETREAWEQWRATESPLASAAEPEPAAEPELPSVERWRAAKAEEPEWEEDDDGLGWEGESAPAISNGNGNGHAPAPEPRAWSGDSRPDWSRGADAPPAVRETDPATAFATAASASAATDVAPSPQPELGRTIALEDDDWDPPVTQTWGARESTSPAAAVAAPGRRKSRKSRMHPVLLVAIYAAVGIGFVVLASTALLGGSSDPTPASKKTPPAAKTPAAPTPVATPKASPTPDAAAEEAAAAAAAAERKARVSFGRERTRARHSASAALSDARAAARRKAKARAKAAAAAKRKRQSSSGASTGNSTPPPVSTPSPRYVPPSQPTPRAPATKRRSVCEFCIG
jgi:hypothetical protein